MKQIGERQPRVVTASWGTPALVELPDDTRESPSLKKRGSGNGACVDERPAAVAARAEAERVAKRTPVERIEHLERAAAKVKK